MEHDAAHIRYRPLKELDVDPDFVRIAEKLGYPTLDALVKTDVPKLMRSKDFDAVWFAKVLQVLKQYGLLNEMENRQRD